MMFQWASQDIKNKTTEQIQKIRGKATNIKSIDKQLKQVAKKKEKKNGTNIISVGEISSV